MRKDAIYLELEKADLKTGLDEMVRQGKVSQTEALRAQTEAIIEAQKYAIAKRYGYTIQPSPKIMRQLVRKKAAEDIKILRSNMADAKRYIPEGADAHHIVASNDFRRHAAIWVFRAQKVLQRWGIDINHEANGVALPGSESKKCTFFSDCESPSHKKVHTTRYYANVAMDVQASGDKDECIDTLYEIGEDLEAGVYGF
ncbi:AHH domain-containing protein [Simiduia curdlanivorans]|uniref:AHH domain-containing protein n=1 Tax=Simiduia curdlanivorans TaxID=1492769 RepID=A0ABV8V7Z9_9GAMM|nr:AHH domain-containing protein [Simiduia curdlanivorans]MDN3639636.1 AHH domain-containing protein [Simiduia curdlanivorans]